MNGFYQERPEIAQAYRDDFERLAVAALRADALAMTLNAERESCLDSLSCRLDVPFRRKLDERSAAALANVNANWLIDGLQRPQGRLSPLLIVPAVLLQKLPASATTVLRQCFAAAPHAELVESLLAGARLMPGDYRFRTEIVDGQPIIAGSDEPNVRALAGLAHELGHCLFEQLTAATGRSFELGSEAFAMILEEVVVERMLADEPSRAAWRSYQRRVEALNLVLYVQEQARIMHRPLADTAAVSRLSFDRSLLLFRESLFSKPGYQAVYAFASLARQRRAAAVPKRSAS